MLCNKCESPLDSETNLCPDCNAEENLEPPTQPEESTNQNLESSTPLAEVPTSDSDSAKSPLSTPAAAVVTQKRRKPALLVAVAVILIAISSIAFFAMRAPVLAVNTAFANLQAEVAERIDGSPLQAFGILMASLDSGLTTVNFTYHEEFSWRSSTFSSDIRLYADDQNRDYAIIADVHVDGIDFDFAAYISGERLALGSRLLDNNYYGITYDTFRNDIRSFGNLVGLSRREMDEMADIVDQLALFMNVDYDPASFADYQQLFTNFLRRSQQSPTRTTIEANDISVRGHRIEYIFTMDEVIALLNDIYNLMSNDEDLHNHFNLFNQAYGRSLQWYLWELEYFIEELEDSNVDGTLAVAFYISNDNRILRAELTLELDLEFEIPSVGLMIDFGTSVNDPWTLVTSFTDRSGTESAAMVWYFTENNGTIENRLTVREGSRHSTDIASLISEWSPVSGRFTLSFEDEWTDGSFGGYFTTSNGGFHLKLDEISSGWGEYFTIEISAEPGVPVPQIDFINIDQWDFDLLFRFEEAFLNLL